jgi:hypothetical protein
MNQRILKLFTKACYHGDYEPENVPNEVVEKFAELIVQECIEVADKNRTVMEIKTNTHLTADAIKEHFGVEL